MAECVRDQKRLPRQLLNQLLKRIEFLVVQVQVPRAVIVSVNRTVGHLRQFGVGAGCVGGPHPLRPDLGDVVLAHGLVDGAGRGLHADAPHVVHQRRE